eukprot:TRINITY_DN5519_c0_g1_i1.p1 TRINITY_DN5519_c0_g1~~TRINITY_DN5519_c0_g1_i1.p1  ORF type:complete len:204 (+),score=56.65 TRINITY_DN5519_c0_g1_i1:118-729(+)
MNDKCLSGGGDDDAFHDWSSFATRPPPPPATNLKQPNLQPPTWTPFNSNFSSPSPFPPIHFEPSFTQQEIKSNYSNCHNVRVRTNAKVGEKEKPKERKRKRGGESKGKQKMKEKSKVNNNNNKNNSKPKDFRQKQREHIHKLEGKVAQLEAENSQYAARSRGLEEENQQLKRRREDLRQFLAQAIVNWFPGSMNNFCDPFDEK